MTARGEMRRHWPAVGFVAALVIWPGQAAAQSVPFGAAINLSNTPGAASDMAAATIDAGTIYVAWREQVSGGAQIRLRRSTNLGVSFADGAGRLVAAVGEPESVFTVRVAATGANVYVLYTAGIEPRFAKARLARSADGGTTFDLPVTLADSPVHGGCAAADLAIGAGGVLHVACEDRDATEQILYLTSTDAGDSFSDPLPLSDAPHGAGAPRLAALGVQVAAVWEARQDAEAGAASDVMFLYSGDGGETFGPAMNLSTSPGDSVRPVVAIGSAIHVVWIEGAQVAIRTSAEGELFSTAAALASAPAGAGIGGVAAASAGATVHVTWTVSVGEDGADGPFYRRSTDAGASFGPVQELMSGGSAIGSPSLLQTTQPRFAWPYSPGGPAGSADVFFAAEPTCFARWAAPVSGSWGVAANWSPAVVPGAGNRACILLDGDYTVTADGNRSIGSVTVSHPGAAGTPVLRVTGTLTVSESVVNEGLITFGAGGHLNTSSTSAVVVNGERGRITTVPGSNAILTAVVVNHGEVVFGANITTSGTSRSFTNRGQWRIEAGATQTMGTAYSFQQEAGTLTVNGAMLLASADFIFRGGHMEGFVTHTGGVTRLRALGGTGGEFRFRQTLQGELYGRLAPSQTIRINAVSTTLGSANTTVTAQPGFANDGTIVLGAEPVPSAGQAAFVATDTVVSHGTIVVETGAGTRRIDAHIENHGLFDVRQSAGMGSTSGRTFVNYGTMSVAPGATVSFGANFVFTQAAGVLQNAGVVEMSAEFSTGGDWFIFNGGSVDGTVIIQGHSHLRIGPGSTGPGYFQFERNVSFGISNGASFGGTVAPAQTLRIVSTVAGATPHTGKVIAASGFTNAGTILIEATAAGAGGSSLEVTSGTLVNQGLLHVGSLGPVKALRGHVENHGTMVVEGQLSFQLANRTFANFGEMTIEGGGRMTLSGATVVNQNAGRMWLDGPIELATEFSTAPDVFNFNGGDIEGGAGVHLVTTSHLNLTSGAIDRKGLFVFRVRGNTLGGTMAGDIGPLQTVRIVGCCASNEGQTVTVANGFTNFGTIVLMSQTPATTAVLNVTSGALVNRGDLIDEDAAGSSTHTINANIENHGRVHLADTMTWSRSNGSYTNRGVFTILPGITLTVTGSATFRNLPPGVLEGGGTLSVANATTLRAAGDLGVNVTNAGIFMPGTSPGAVDIAGAYTQTGTGRLEIEVAGSAPGTGFDRVNVGGTATLAGTLDVRVAPGLCVQGSYPFMAYAAVAGDFATKTGLTGLAGGRSLVTSRQPTEYLLNASGDACNAAPAAADDAYAVDEDTTLVVDAPGVLGNDSDADGDTLSAVLVSGPSHGTLTLHPNGGFSYQPDENYQGPDSFTYRASDGQVTGNVATVSILVRPVVDPPAAIDDAVTIDEDAGPTVIDVLANDAVGPDGGALSVTAAGPALHGLVALLNGVVTYTPPPDFHGTDSFGYTVEDGVGGAASATVIVTVGPINDPPVLMPLADRAVEAGSTVAFTLEGADVDGDALVFSASGLPAGATLDPVTGAFAWTPEAAQAGNHTMTFTVTDPGGLDASQSVTIAVTASGGGAWPFRGFLGPVSNPPTMNVAKAGSAIPMKFSLGGDRGLEIFAPGSPFSIQISCTTGSDENDATETASAGQSSLSYTAASDQYAYVWKTEAAWAGTCRQFVIRLLDGSTHVASFKFR